MRFLKLITTIFAIAVVLFGCSRKIVTKVEVDGTEPVINTSYGSAIVTGKRRPATDPDDVIVYLDPPSQYETIGMVDATVPYNVSQQVTQDNIVKILKNQTANIGGNGVILIDIDSKLGFYSETERPPFSDVYFYRYYIHLWKTAKGRVIYVESAKEPVGDTPLLPETNHGATVPPDSAKEAGGASP